MWTKEQVEIATEQVKELRGQTHIAKINSDFMSLFALWFEYNSEFDAYTVYVVEKAELENGDWYYFGALVGEGELPEITLDELTDMQDTQPFETDDYEAYKERTLPDRPNIVIVENL